MRTTLVSCLYDLRAEEGNAARRGLDDYFRHGEFLLGLDEDVVFFAEASIAAEIESGRAARGLGKRTLVVPTPFEELPSARLLDAVTSAHERRPVLWLDPEKDTPRYIVLGWSKPGLVREAMQLDPFGADRFGWIDFGIAHVARTRFVREDGVFHPADPRVGLLQIGPLPSRADAFREASLEKLAHRVAGGFFIGGRQPLERFRDLFDREAKAALAAGIAPLEIQLFARLLAVEPELFRPWPGDYESILENSVRIRGSAENLLHQIRAYRHLGEGEKVRQLVERVLESVRSGLLEAADPDREALLLECARKPDRPRLCLNMIVRNEAAIIERCLASVAPWIDAWVIADTGSTDGTPGRIRAFFEGAGIPGELHEIPFDDFSSARNLALEACRKSAAAFDYILLADADMELVVEDPVFRDRLTVEAHLVQQRAGISYLNVRLVRRTSAARYVGVTHEYLSTGSPPEVLDGIWFRDHSDGSNRAEKSERDLRLLGEGLEREPGNGRYMFYLAQTLRDAGRWAEALEWYRRRVAAGGPPEECWYAMYAAALCMKEMGDEPGFVWQVFEAYGARPWRAEPLYHLAAHYRKTGRNEACAALSEMGSKIPYPAQDVLFVEDFVYTAGFREELSISGFYCSDPDRRRRGGEACLSLTIDPAAPPRVRDQARANSIFYSPMAAEMFGGCELKSLEVPCDLPFVPLNPSVWTDGERWLAIVRTVNYAITEQGYPIRDDSGKYCTRNWLVPLDGDFRATGAREIRDVSAGPPRFPSWWDGFEDCRLFELGGRLLASCTVLDRTPESRAEVAVLELDAAGDVSAVHVQRSVRPDVHQKNWVPLVRGGELLFVYKADPTVLLRFDPAAGQARVFQTGRPEASLEALRGGSQAIAVPGGWLYAAHEVVHPGGRRHYLHRFVLLDEGLRVAAVSGPFTFTGAEIELCAGLARDERSGRLVASFGVHDDRAFLALLDERAVLASLGRPGGLPRG